MIYNIEIPGIINKPVSEVFEAIVEPGKLNRYFTSRSSGIIESGKTVIWEFKDQNVILDIDIIETEQDKRISFRWRATGNDTYVSINLESDDDNNTKIIITEKEFSSDESDIKTAMQQTIGWTDFICSLKAYLYTGINLRDGNFG